MELQMDKMTEGTRIHVRRNSTFDAEVVVSGEIVWNVAGYSTREEAQHAADQKLLVLKIRL
jgi:hypothetical protein